METSNLVLWDRSRTTTDWTCRRSRYLNYELDGYGIVPEAEAYALAFGTAIHEALASIAIHHRDSLTINIDNIAQATGAAVMDFLSTAGKPTEYVKEQSTLAEGLVRGFYAHVWPRVIATYPKILAIEQEMSYKYGRTLFMAKPDLVVADKEGGVHYLEWKTTSSNKEDWINSWDKAIQLHATTRAIEAALGEPIVAVHVIGLYKGWLSYGKQSSPLCYAYKRNGSPPFSKDEISYEYKGGFRRSPVWELPGGVKSWVEGMPEEVLANQFPTTPPIFINDSQVEAFFRQRNIREQEIDIAKGMLAVADDEAREAILDTAFEQDFSKCKPAWGSSCPYQIICHGHVPEPLKAGFTRRQPHHDIEEASLGSR